MKEELTGRFRFRLWQDLLVLQVERTGFYTDNVGGSIDTHTFTDFRDARIEDVTTCRSMEGIKGALVKEKQQDS